MLGRSRPRLTSADAVGPEVIDIVGTIAGDHLAERLGEPVARLAESTAGNRTMKGGMASPQRFVVPAGGPNTEEALEVAPISVSHRRLLNKRRGTLNPAGY